MSRLKPLAPDANLDLHDTFEHFRSLLGYVPNNALVLSRKPKIVKGLAQLASAVWDPANEVDRGLKRLVAYLASRTHGSKYSMAHSAEAAHRSGVSDAKVEAVDEYRSSPLFSEAERAAGEMRIAAALLERSRLQHQDARAVLAGGDRGAERGIAGADHKHVGPLARKIGCGHRFLAGSAQVMHRRGCALRPPAASHRSQ
jgi:alkylhydroperoxidase family enzyme